VNPWDVAAGKLIAREAGAETADLADGTVVVAAPGLLESLLDLLKPGAVADAAGG